MAHIQVLVEADTMAELVANCNMISIKSGISYEFGNYITDGKKFYCTYYVDLESNDVFRKVRSIERNKKGDKSTTE